MPNAPEALPSVSGRHVNELTFNLFRRQGERPCAVAAGGVGCHAARQRDGYGAVWPSCSSGK